MNDRWIYDTTLEEWQRTDKHKLEPHNNQDPTQHI